MIDVLVVGAGPAGSSAAARLASAGFEVVVLERSRFPRSKVCGEYVSPGACASLSDLGLLETIASEAHVLRKIVLAGFGSDAVCLELPGHGALSIPRTRFDELLLQHATRAGARVEVGTFLGASEERASIDVRLRDGDGVERMLSTRVLVGADGAWSSVAQRTGLCRGQRKGGRWAVGGHLRDQADGDALEMYVGPGGYYARNPIGGGIANSMLVLPKACLGDAAERAVTAITDGRHRFDGNALQKQVAVGPLRYAPDRVARGRVLLAGDAAGLLDPFVGQGMAIALETSTAVAAASEALLAGQDSVTVLRRYAAARREAVLPRQLLAAAVDAVIRNRFLRGRAERSIKRDPAPAEAILAAVAGAVPAKSALSWRSFASLVA